MLTAILLSLLAGSIIGRFFKAGILVAVSAVLLLLILCVGVAQASPWWSIALSSLLALTALQIGYLAVFTAEAYAPREDGESLQGSGFTEAGNGEHRAAAQIVERAGSLG